MTNKKIPNVHIPYLSSFIIGHCKPIALVWPCVVRCRPEVKRAPSSSLWYVVGPCHLDLCIDSHSKNVLRLQACVWLYFVLWPPPPPPSFFNKYSSTYIYIQSNKIWVPRDVRNSKVWKHDKFLERLVSILEHMHAQNGTGPGIRKSKRPLIASHTRYKGSVETSRN